MKNLLYLHFINDRYSRIEESLEVYDYVSHFLDDFGTSVALRMNAWQPKDEEEHQKVEEAYEIAVNYEEEVINTPETFWTRLDDSWHRVIQAYYECIWIGKNLLQRIFR